jgi:hypothetical protein
VGKKLADRHTLCKYLEGHGLFTGLFYKYATTYKEMRDSTQPSSMELGQEDVSQAEQNKRRKRDRNSEDELCTKKQNRPLSTNQNPRPVATNNIFAPLRDLHVENGEPGSEGNSTKTPGTNESQVKCRLPPSH